MMHFYIGQKLKQTLARTVRKSLQSFCLWSLFLCVIQPVYKLRKRLLQPNLLSIP